MPAGMPKAASDAWKKIVPLLEAAGYLAEVDCEALRQLCESISDYEAFGAEIKKHGRLVAHFNTLGNKVLKLNPAWTARKDCRAAIVSLLQKLGMTPTGRTGLGEKDSSGMPPELAALLGINLN